ncbi:type II/IV secretion system ATPase subunit [Candidatus Woesearchaeota archaeon]|nr:type II/IV secretion system ATPase subunit [Candidatus Woesearchaeota archaeon]
MGKEYSRNLEKTENLAEARKRFPHLEKYYQKLAADKIPTPEFYPALGRDMKNIKDPNLIYPVGDPIFIHIRREIGKPTEYNVIEPTMDDSEKKIYEKVMERLVHLVYKGNIPEDLGSMQKIFKDLLATIITYKDDTGMLNPKIKVTKAQYEKIEYYLIRNRVGYGKLEPLFYDPNLEDIHCTGVGKIKTIHKIFDLVYTSIVFKDDNELNRYIVDVSERVERPTSDAHSVVDAMMPDGSRVNFIYGRDVSLEGSSFTIRKFSSVPVSVTQVINWGTISAELAAYLWIALENGMNLFVCGETASGKTTTLNAISAFIKPTDKVYTVENTPEVTMPHDVWQHLVTRGSDKEAKEGSGVSYLDLLIAALRSRPNYIIVGEIRGEEGAIAFQAMQTGHPVMSTFHAGKVQTMIQRITGDPINVPIAFVDNLNLVLIQMAVGHNGKVLRRVLSLTEIERFYEAEQKVITKEVFTWNSTHDKHVFRGLYNSYILEQKIAKMQGYEDPRKIYDEMFFRTKILKKMIEEKIFNYYDVWELLKKFHFQGPSALPFKV